MFPGGIIRLLEVKKYSEDMITPDKTVTNKSLKRDEVIQSGAVLAKPTLVHGQEIMKFQIPYKATIDHTFHGFAEAAGECNRAIVIRHGGVLAWLGNWDDGSLAPAGREGFLQPNRVENIKKDRQNRCWEVLEKGIMNFVRAHSSVMALTERSMKLQHGERFIVRFEAV